MDDMGTDLGTILCKYSDFNYRFISQLFSGMVRFLVVRRVPP
jgi:hypothetical protein